MFVMFDEDDEQEGGSGFVIGLIRLKLGGGACLLTTTLAALGKAFGFVIVAVPEGLSFEALVCGLGVAACLS